MKGGSPTLFKLPYVAHFLPKVGDHIKYLEVCAMLFLGLDAL